MSHFYSAITTSARRTVPTARGHKSTGITAYCASYAGRITTHLWHDTEGVDRFEVTMEPHEGKGDRQIIASGRVGDAAAIKPLSAI